MRRLLFLWMMIIAVYSAVLVLAAKDDNGAIEPSAMTAMADLFPATVAPVNPAAPTLTAWGSDGPGVLMATAWTEEPASVARPCRSPRLIKPMMS